MTTPQSPEQGNPQQQNYYGQYPQQGGHPQQPGQPPQQWGPPPQYTQGPPPQPPKKKRTGLKIALGVVVAIVVIAIATSGGGDDPAAPAGGESAAAPAASGPQNVKFGQEVTSGDLVLTASAPKKTTEFGMTQACSTVTYKNNGDQPASFNPFDWKFTTAAGVETSASIPFSAGAKALNSGQLAPGGTTSGTICGDQQTTDVNAVKYAPTFSLADPVTWTN